MITGAWMAARQESAEGCERGIRDEAVGGELRKSAPDERGDFRAEGEEWRELLGGKLAMQNRAGLYFQSVLHVAVWGACFCL